MRIQPKQLIPLTGLALAAASGGVALATSNGIVTTPLARGKLVMPVINVDRQVAGGRVKIQTQGALDVLMLNGTLAPGASSGWDKLAGPVIVVVKQGTLTLIDAKCIRHDLPAGGANIAPGTTPRNLENRGTTTVSFNVTFLIPHGVTKPDIDTSAPAGCTA